MPKFFPQALIVFLLIACGTIFPIARADEIRYDKGARRDPFLSLVGPNSGQGQQGWGKGEAAIEGIVYDPKGGSYVIINGEIYREGDNANGANVVRVFPDRVILNQESEQLVMWLREEIYTRTEGSGQGKLE